MPSSVVDALTSALYGDQFDRVHAPWRTLLSTAPFRFREGLTYDERIALSYERLRLVNEHMADPYRFTEDVEALAALHEWLAPVDPGLVTLASIHYNLFLGSLQQYGTTPSTAFARMDRMGSFLCTEAAHGNSASQLETTATYSPETETFVLHTPTKGAAKFMPNTSSLGGPKSGVVAARLIVRGKDEGVFLFLTPLQDAEGRAIPGIEIRRLPQTSTHPIDHSLTVFHRVHLPYEAMLQADHGRLTRDGEFSSSVGNRRRRFLMSIGRVTAGKACMSACGLGLVRQAVAVAMRHAHRRHTAPMTAGANVPLMAYRSHHGPLLDGLVTAYAATLLQRLAVRRLARAEGEERDDADRLIAMTKGWVTWQARAVMTECRERCGAQGLFLANGIAGELAALEGTITAEGDNTVIWAKAAGELLLGNFSPAAENEGAPADLDLADPEVVQRLLGSVEGLCYERARGLLRGKASGALHRWNRTVTAALELVDAHVRRLAAGELLRAAQSADDPEARRLLHDMHRYFALRQIARHSGQLLAEGRVTADHVRVLPDLCEELIEGLAPHAMTLTEGMAMPEEWLRDSPMARAETAAAG
ncbi:acyl-CoA dehydrogenase [Streptomyces sp. NPDC050560]|uniref:acyl-CoA dehydrogenase family protein n=1 Tax=Streptomyces sp. NPDC050560 TaxID=3365630 RepID=UPI00379F5740